MDPTTDIPKRTSPYRVVVAFWAIGAGLWILPELWSLIAAVVLTVIIGLVLDVPVSAMARHRIPRGAATAIVFLATLGAIIGCAALVAPTVSSQLDGLVKEHGALDVALIEHVNDVLSGLPGNISIDAKGGGLADFAGNLAGPGLVAGVGNAATIFIVALFAAAWAVAAPDPVIARLLAFVPPAKRERTRTIAAKVEVRLRSWMAGQLTLCVAVGAATYILLRALNVPFAALFAVLAGFLEAVPMIGIFLASVPPVAITLLDQPNRTLPLIIGIVAIQQLEDRALVPVVMKRAIEMPQAILMLFLYGAGTFFGPAGLMIGVPVMAAAVTIHDAMTAYDGDEEQNAAAPDAKKPRRVRLPLKRSRPPEPDEPVAA